MRHVANDHVDELIRAIQGQVRQRDALVGRSRRRGHLDQQGPGPGFISILGDAKGVAIDVSDDRCHEDLRRHAVRGSDRSARPSAGRPPAKIDTGRY